MEITPRGRAAARRRTSGNAKLKVANGHAADGLAPAVEVDLKKLLRALQAVRDGEFSVRLPPDQTGRVTNSVKADVMYLIPRDDGWGLTAQDLQHQKFEYLREMV